METRAIDLWVNATMGRQKQPEFMVRVKEDYFHAGADFFKDLSPAEMLEAMDEAGVEKAIVTTPAEDPVPEVLAFPEAYPERFALAAHMEPRHGMKAIRALEAIVKNQPVVMAKVVPFLLDLAPDDRVYYPVYAKCIELDLPISVNTGIPGPPMPGACQHPLHLDRVCLDFPELELVMAHGADPWWDVAIRLMLKYANLYLMTSAYAPKYFPPELIHYMNTRGQHKIMFATDHPVISMQRCVREAAELDLREGVLDKYLYSNAAGLFFDA